MSDIQIIFGRQQTFSEKNFNKRALNHIVWYTNHFCIDFWKLLRPPLIQFSKFNNHIWVCWFLGKNLSNLVPPVWKLHNPYCHTHQPKESLDWKVLLTVATKIALRMNLFFKNQFFLWKYTFFLSFS